MCVEIEQLVPSFAGGLATGENPIREFIFLGVGGYVLRGRNGGRKILASDERASGGAGPGV